MFMKEIYQYIIPPAGEIIPEGWIREQLKRDLKEGFVGHFDQVHPTVTHNVFIKQDRSSKRKFSLRKEWWAGEHEGYWKDSVIRMAFLTGDEAFMERSHRWIREILDNTGRDGYIGIYQNGDTPYSRFRHAKGNGELWASSRIMMAMLAYFEFTGSVEVFDAVEKAVALIMEQYRDSNYFEYKSTGGGLSHGVGFFEILEWMYRITRRKEFLDFSVKLYVDFNNGNARDDDLKTHRLLDEDRYFRKHGAHIAEGLFIPELIASITGSREHRMAADNAIRKLRHHLTPGGAMRCDEWIKGRKGTADERYEYCGIAEMVSPLHRIFCLTGNMEMADLVEVMTFNAGQGARFPVLKALSYLTTDNRIRINHRELGRRESYDAAHFAAACCVLNGGRLMPYYIESMWVTGDSGEEIGAVLFGPSRFRTRIGKIPVEISEETNYPFSDRVSFRVTPEKPVEFSLVIRKPQGCNRVKTAAPKGTESRELSDRIILRRKWKKGEEVQVEFPFAIEQIEQPASSSVPGRGIYLKRGPLVYALAFPHRSKVIREHLDSGFYRHGIKANSTKGWKYRIPDDDAEFSFIPADGQPVAQPWEKPPVRLKGKLVNADKMPVITELVPMGATLLRRVTFPVAGQTDRQEKNQSNQNKKES